MADNVAITAGSGTNIATDDVSGAHYQKMKLYDGTADSTNAAIVDSSGNLQVEVTNTGITGTAGTPNAGVLSVQGITSMTPVQAQLVAGTAAYGKLAANSGVDIGDVDVTSVPADPFGANADAASSSGSISAKLREIATNGVILKAGTAAIGKLAANDGVDIGNVDVASLPALPTGSNAIGKLAANSGVDIGDVDVLSLPAYTVDKSIQWSHYSNEYTTTQTSTDLVALSGSTKFYIGRLTIGTGGTTSGLVTVYFGTGAYSAGTSKTVFRGNFAPSATVYPGVVIGNGSAPFCISAAGDALKITTSAGITVYVQVDYIRV